MSGEDRRAGEPRFPFGRNWRAFLEILDDDRIHEAELSLRRLLGVSRLEGCGFLDVGCGSGLFSLAARRLGARVVSFDYDPDSVACAEALRERYLPGDEGWTIARGSALDSPYLASLGRFELVYAWGVLHHTGDLWRAVDLVADRVADGGRLALALYNDQGVISRIWRGVKRIYVAGGLGRALVLALFVPLFVAYGLAADLVRLRDPRRRYAVYRRNRGMSIVHDWIDWLGGYPFEVARPGEVVEALRQKGFRLALLRPTRGWGNNELVFVRERPEVR